MLDSRGAPLAARIAFTTVESAGASEADHKTILDKPSDQPAQWPTGNDLAALRGRLVSHDKAAPGSAMLGAG